MYSQQYDGYRSSSEIQLIPNVGYILGTNNKQDTKKSKMEYADGKVKDLQIAYIGGGSRGWAWTFMTDLAMDEELSGTIRLYDIDAEAAKTQ